MHAKGLSRVCTLNSLGEKEEKWKEQIGRISILSLWFVCHDTSFLGEKQAGNGVAEERVQKFWRFLVSGQCFWYVKAWTFCNGVSLFTNGTQTSWGSILRDRHCRHLENLLRSLQTKNLLQCHQVAFFGIVLRHVSVTCFFFFFAKLVPWALQLLIAICRSVSILVQFSYIRLSSLGSPFVAASSLFLSWSRCAFSSAMRFCLKFVLQRSGAFVGVCNRRKIFCKQVLYYERGCPNPGLATKF